MTTVEKIAAIKESFSDNEAVIDRLSQNGVTFIDKKSAFVAKGAAIGAGTVIMPGVVIEGGTVIGENCIIGPNSRICDCKIGDETEVSYSVAISSVVGRGTSVGPFAYIRPNCTIGENVKIGDFVELKNSNIGNGSKASHLTYIGDADVGENVNFGCGTVVVNYNGRKKFRAVVCDDAFIGCNTNLISPVSVGEGAFIAAGSTITDDVPSESFAIARARQVVKHDWKDIRKG